MQKAARHTSAEEEPDRGFRIQTGPQGAAMGLCRAHATNIESYAFATSTCATNVLSATPMPVEACGDNQISALTATTKPQHSLIPEDAEGFDDLQSTLEYALALSVRNVIGH